MTVLTVVFTLVVYLADRATLGLPSTYAIQAPMLIGLAAVWPAGGLPRSRAGFGVMGLLLTASIAPSVALGVDVWTALCTAVGALAYALAVGALYRRRFRRWMPTSSAQILSFALFATAASPVPLLVQGYPGIAWSTLSEAPHVALIACLRGAAATIIGGVTALPLCFAGRPHTRAPHPLVSLLLTAAAVGAPWLIPSFSNTPISWVLVLPMVFAAMLTTIRWVAVITFASCISELFVPNPPFGDALSGRLPGALGLDLLFAFMPLIALLISLARDNTARLGLRLRAATAAEQVQATLLSRVYEAMADGVIVTNEDGEVTVANRAAAALAGRPLPARFSDAWVEAVNAQTAQAQRLVRAEDVRSLLSASGRAESAEVVLQGEHGEPRVLCLSRRRLRLSGQELQLHLVSDVTAEQRTRKELESFAGTVAHDLKSPLAALLGWLDDAREALARGANPSHAALGLRHAQVAAHRMHALIDDYLAYAVAREGSLHLVDIPLAQLAEDVSALYRSSTPGALTVDIEAPHPVRVDASLARQLLGNLIGNSVKYSRPGEGTSVRVLSIDHEPGWVQVQVADRGVGLQPGDEERIFEAFNRSEKDAAGHHGVGLGLALCHAIVARHGGRIWAEPNEWGGATLRFTLPAGSR